MDLPAFAPDGSPVYIPEEQAAAAQAQGFRVDEAALARQQAQAAEAARFDAPLTAGLAGAARGLSLGTSDLAFTKLGGDPATLKGLEEYNPTASIIGEGVGMLAPLALSDGAAAPAEAGTLARLKGLVTAPTRALGAVAEGAGELGAKAGLGELGQAAVRGAVEGAGYQMGNNLSDSAIQDHPLTASALFDNVGEAMLFGGAAGGAVDKLVGAVTEHAPAMLQRADDALEHLAQRAELGAEAPGLKAALRDSGKALDEVAEHLTSEAMPARVRQLLQDAPPLAGVPEALAQAAKAAPEAEAVIAWASKAAEGATSLAEQHELLAKLAAKLDAAPQAQAELRGILSAPAFGEAGKYTAQVEQSLAPVRAARAAVEAAAPAERPAAIAAYREAAGKALDDLQTSTYRHVTGPTTSLDTLQRSLDTLHAGAAPAPMPTHGGLLAGLGEHSGALGLLMHLPGMHHLAAPLAAVGAGAELARVVRGGQSATVARIARQAGEKVAAIQSGVAAALGPTTASKAARAATAASALPSRSPEAVAQRASQVRAMAQQPALIAQRASQSAPLTLAHAPQVGAALTGTAARAVQYLAQVAPRDPRPPSPMPSAPWVPSRTETEAYARVEAVVLQPSRVLTSMRAGQLTPAEVEACRTVHPDYYARVVQAAMDHVTALSRPPPYSAQLQLDVLLGKPISPMGQAAPVLANAQPPPPQPQPPPRSGGAKHLTLGERSDLDIRD